MKYDVTIGIPVYQSVDYIKRTIESVLSQTFLSLEILVIDDCGRDGSISVVEDYQRKHIRGKDIRILYNEKNYGVGFSRNRIIDEARGFYLFFLDSDDCIESNTIQSLFDVISYSRSQIVYGSYKIIDCIQNNKPIIYQKPYLELNGEGKLAEFAYRYSNVFQISACNFLIDLQFLRTSGVRFVNMSYWEDMAFTYEMVTKVSKAILLPNITYHYIKHLNSLSHFQNRNYYCKSEILKNISIIDYLKDKCRGYKGKNYLPYLCYRLEVNSFYVICYVLKHYSHISPRIPVLELRDYLHFPVSFLWVLKFKSKFIHNMAFWILAHLPVWLFEKIIYLLGKLKGLI